METGQTISHYKILEKLGEGGMGEVYLAEDTRLDRKVALKFLPKFYSADTNAKRRFMHEARSAAALDHPNICTIYDIGETDDGQLYIAMAHYRGETLEEKISEGRLPADEAVDMVLGAARGLAAVHREGVIHRDIKPSNILVTDEGVIKVIDFGLAKLAGRTTLTREGSTLGTVSYMSPEQTEGREVDARSDIWALGVVLYELLAGKRPFEGDYEQAVIYSILHEEPEQVGSVNQAVPDELERIVSKAMQKDLDLRYASLDEMIDDLAAYRGSRGDSAIGLDQWKKKAREPVFLGSVLLILTVLVLGMLWYADRQADIQWARTEALPRIERMVDSTWRDYTDAYRLASRVEEVIPGNEKLAELLDEMTLDVTIHTDPEGASVYIKEYDTPGAEWQRIGTTPVEGFRMPVGIFRFKFTREGYEEVLATSSTWAIRGGEELLVPNEITRKLDPAGSLPEGMVRVPATETPRGTVNGFFIDKYEVTNRAFKAFVDAGGYSNPAYWKHRFVNEGEELAFEEAMELFRDETGRPGPAGWQAGGYPEGEARYPVTGVSWYEAAAYAEFAGKSLPTGIHWDVARGRYTPMITFPQLGGFALLAPFSNFGGDGPVEVGTLPGITSYGAYDMAGNVREWCFNEMPAGRLQRGGAWNDNTYMFGNLGQAPAIDRPRNTGFRTVRYPDRSEVPEAFFEKVTPRPRPDVYAMEPVSDQIFEVYRQQFSYDRTPFNAERLSVDDDHEEWVFERVRYDAPYGGGDEQIIANLFLPKNVDPPYQTVVYFPGSGSLNYPSSENLEEYFEFPVFLSYLVKNGRAVVYPVYKGTFERREMELAGINNRPQTHAYSEFVVQLVKDFRRTVDYLETREEFDTGKLAYYGMSWGGMLGAIIPAVDNRLDVSVLIPGALQGVARPEVNQLNYIGRVTIPTLMLNGRYDTILPLETNIRPMYDLLGTPEEHKELILYDTDHIPPKTEIIKETLNWLDKYLGPVR